MYPVQVLPEERRITADALASNPSGRRTIIRNDITTGNPHPVTTGGTTVVRPQLYTAAATKRSKKSRLKSSTVAIYISVFALLIAVIAVGYRAPQPSAQATTPVANTAPTTDQPAVNDVVATNIAASVAASADLAVASNVAELAVTTRVQSQYVQAGDTAAVSKPAIISLSSASRNITTYTVVAGDSVPTVAAKYGISADTVRWANNLTGDVIAVGSNLEILPRDGIVYTVKDGDTIQKIADKYKADVSAITTYNDLELNGLTTGLKIVIPNGVLPTNERPGYKSPTTVATGTFITGYSAGFASGGTWFIKKGTPNNGKYAYGNCTAYAFDRRAELGRPIGAMWGNAGSWATNARAAGFVVDRTPEAGAVIQDYGHVAIVEAIMPNGDLSLSEMNASVSGGGYNIVSGRILPASQIGQYYYIH